MHQLLFFVFTLLSCSIVFSQTKEAYANAMLKKGISLYAPDSTYSLNLKFRVQNRLALTTLSEKNLAIKETEARVRRLRLGAEGFVFNPKLAYKIQLAFARADIETSNNEAPNIVRDAIIFYNFNENFSVGLGQSKLPGSRQQITSSNDLQLPDRSIVSSVFSLDRDFGIQTYYINNIGKTAIYRLRGAVSNGEGKNTTKNNTGFCYSARAEFLPLGKFTNNGDYFEGDLVREAKPKIAMAFSYSYNHKTTKTGGQLGENIAAERNIVLVYADFLIKYKGWTWATELAQRNCYNPIIYTKSKTQYVYVGNGLNSQLSYLFKNNYELITKYSAIAPNKRLKLLESKKQQIAVGASKYLQRHRIKLQSDIVYESNTWLTFNKNNWMWRFQFEFGI